MVVAGTTLVGRTHEVGVLDQALTRTAGGEAIAVAVLGEPGIGKTRLLNELSARAEARGHLALTGTASERELGLPYRVLADALDDYVRSLPASILPSVDPETVADLAPVLPQASRTGPGPIHTQHRRIPAHRVHLAMRELLERLASRRPLVLLLDDVHWADRATVDLVGALLRRPPDASVLLALALRPDQAHPRLRHDIARAARGRGLVQLPLAPLTRTDARALVDATAHSSIDEASLVTLHDEAGGNPFYLEQLVRSFVRAERTQGQVRAPRPSRLVGDSAVPAAVASAIDEELEHLLESSRVVLRGAAVIGDPFEPELVAAAARTSESSVLRALDDLLRQGLITTTEVPRRFRFRHPLVRRAVYESTPAGWRLSAHAAGAAALEIAGAPATERAHHVERSARRGDVSAVATLREAGDAVTHRAPESAAHWYAAALRALRDDAPVEERAELLLARAGALTCSGHFEQAHAALLESIDLAPEDARGLRVRLTTACAATEHLLGRHGDARRRLLRALAHVGDGSGTDDLAVAVDLRLELAVGGLFEMQFDEIRSQARAALELADQLGEPLLVATAEAVLAWGSGLVGDVAEAERHCDVAAGLVEEISDRRLAERLDAVVHLAGAELYCDRFAAAGRHAHEVIDLARMTDQPAVVPFAFLTLAWVRMLRGELTHGADMLEGAIEEARLLGNTQTLAGLLLNRSLTAVGTHDIAMGTRAAREAVELTVDMEAGLIPAASTLALTAALLEADDPDLAAAVDLMVERCGGEALPRMPGASFRAKWLELLTRSSLALGRRGAAERAARSAAKVASAPGGLRMARSLAERATAEVALAKGDLEKSARAAVASAALADEVGLPVEAALSRLVAGRALMRAGDHGPAMAQLDRAAASFDACGALRYRDAADLELRRLGRRVHRRPRTDAPRPGWAAALTDREREVAELVVDRRTNQEIAARLFLSPKTVETHLRHIFDKLEVRRRADIARALQQAGVPSAPEPHRA